ncbi:hypothetical protein EIN_484750 [Entamoeba invadens IP1]|uniref:BEACH domain-containing protein n=1 Tax=Entamoeba invadens IP1 TaxID=370355 RepID=A0A0A1UAC2_ENTIV|nr:hypothetical protein EIN_484750 [Entamoeba invadens IP1]ELP89133.1 hypothetical protein EIN_484750 [Entamoeba invadens IP1]|eukprot:XP_004255904.1 hypothetical protein EIN_484750 [Entamoeba invadens IP1]
MSDDATSSFSVGIPYFCGQVYDPLIPIDSFVYTIHGDLLTLLEKVQSQTEEQIYHTLNCILKNPINCDYLKPEVLLLIIHRLKDGVSDRTAFHMIDVLCRKISSYFDNDLFESFLSLYSSISSTRALQLTQSISTTLLKRNNPRIYYEFTGFNTYISTVLSIHHFPETSAVYHTKFKMTKYVQHTTPIVFSFCSNSFGIKLLISSSSKLIIETDVPLTKTDTSPSPRSSLFSPKSRTSFKEKVAQQNYSMAMMKKIETDIKVLPDTWHSIFIIHTNDNALQFVCNEKTSEKFFLPYPSIHDDSVFLLQIAGSSDEVGKNFIGDVTGFQLFFNSSSVSEVNKLQLNEVVFDNETEKCLALQVSPLRSMMIGDRAFFKKVTSVVNQAINSNKVSVCSYSVSSNFSPIFAISNLRIDDMVLRVGGLVQFFSILNFGFDSDKYNQLNTPALFQLLSSIFKQNDQLRSQCEEMRFYNIILQYILSVQNKDMGCAIDFISICVRLFTNNLNEDLKKVAIRYMFDVDNWIGSKDCLYYPDILSKMIPPTTCLTNDVFKYITYEQMVTYIIANAESMACTDKSIWLGIKCRFIQFCVDLVIRSDIKKFVEICITILQTNENTPITILLLFALLCILCNTTQPPQSLKTCTQLFIHFLNSNVIEVFIFSLKILFILCGESEQVISIARDVFPKTNLSLEVFEAVIECSTGIIKSELSQGIRLENVTLMKYSTLFVEYFFITLNGIMESTTKEELTPILLKDVSTCDLDHPVFMALSKYVGWEQPLFLLVEFFYNKQMDTEKNMVIKIIVKILINSFKVYNTVYITTLVIKMEQLFPKWKDAYHIVFSFFSEFLKHKPFELTEKGILILECGMFISQITCGMCNYGKMANTFFFEEQFALISSFFEGLKKDDLVGEFVTAKNRNDNLYPMYYSFFINLILSHLRALSFKNVTDVKKYTNMFDLLCAIFKLVPPKRNNVFFIDWFVFYSTTFLNTLTLPQVDKDVLKLIQLNMFSAIKNFEVQNETLFESALNLRQQLLGEIPLDFSTIDSVDKFTDILNEAYHTITSMIGVERMVFDNYNTKTVEFKRVTQTKIPPKVIDNTPIDVTRLYNDILAFKEKEYHRFKKIQNRFSKPRNLPCKAFYLKGFNNPLKPIFLVKSADISDVVSLNDKFCVEFDLVKDITLPLNAELSTGCIVVFIDEYQQGTFFLHHNRINIKTKTKWIEQELSEIVCIVLRKFRETESACELFTTDNKPLFIAFSSQQICQNICKTLTQLSLDLKVSLSLVNSSSKIFASENYMKDWVDAKISTFEYLCILNFFAGRSFVDISQYYIFPWVTFSFNKSFNYVYNNTDVMRNFSEPMCALYEDFHDKNFYKYGPLPATAVPLYLSQLQPFGVLQSIFNANLMSTNNLYTENSTLNFDYKNIHYSPLNNINDISKPRFCFEAIPEFYSCSPLFTNEKNDTEKIKFNTEFAKNQKQFVLFHRMLLESPAVSKKINEWFDLIFGKKMKDKTYPENACKNTPRKMSQLVGVSPQMLFKTHPKRKLSFDYTILVEEMQKENRVLKDLKRNLEYENIVENANDICVMNSSITCVTKDTLSTFSLKTKKLRKCVSDPCTLQDVRKMYFTDDDDEIGVLVYSIGCQNVIVYYRDLKIELHTTTGNIMSLDMKELSDAMTYQVVVGTFSGILEVFTLKIDRDTKTLKTTKNSEILVSPHPITKLVYVPTQNFVAVKSGEQISVVSTVTKKVLQQHDEKEVLYISASGNGNIYYIKHESDSLFCVFSDINGVITDKVPIRESVVSLDCVSCSLIDYVLVATLDKVLIFFNTYASPILLHTITFGMSYPKIKIKAIVTQPASVSTSLVENWFFYVKGVYQDNSVLLRCYTLDDVKLVAL